jgi:hypothetical protein
LTSSAAAPDVAATIATSTAAAILQANDFIASSASFLF